MLKLPFLYVSLTLGGAYTDIGQAYYPKVYKELHLGKALRQVSQCIAPEKQIIQKIVCYNIV